MPANFECFCSCHICTQVKNSSQKIMQALGEKLNMPVRNTKLFPFGEPGDAAAASEGAEEEKKAPGMLEEVQVRPCVRFFAAVFCYSA